MPPKQGHEVRHKTKAFPKQLIDPCTLSSKEKIFTLASAETILEVVILQKVKSHLMFYRITAKFI